MLDGTIIFDCIFLMQSIILIVEQNLASIKNNDNSLKGRLHVHKVISSWTKDSDFSEESHVARDSMSNLAMMIKLKLWPIQVHTGGCIFWKVGSSEGAPKVHVYKLARTDISTRLTLCHPAWQQFLREPSSFKHHVRHYVRPTLEHHQSTEGDRKGPCMD